MPPPGVGGGGRRRSWCWSVWSSFRCGSCVVVGVVWVLVVVVVGVLVVVVACGSGCVQSASARRRRFVMPLPSVLRRPASTVVGSAAKSLFGLRDRGFGGGAVAFAALRPPGRRLRSRSAAARRWRSGSGPCRSSRRRRAARRRRRAAGERRRISRFTVIDRTPGARRASPVGAPRGSRRRRRRRRSWCAGRRPSARRGRAAARRRAGRRRVAARRCRDSAAIRRRRDRAARPRAAVRRWRAAPSWRTNESATCEWPIRQMRSGWRSRQSSASSAESTYSHTGSRGLAW